MTTRKYSSRSQQTTLSAALTSSGTIATVVSVNSLLGGTTISAGETFTVVIDPNTALEEIVDVTATSSNTLTIVRGIDGSSGQAHSAGAVIRHMAIGRDYREANTHSESTTGVHGLSGAPVGTTDTQTLSNKTLSTGNTISGTITGGTINATALQVSGVPVVTTTASQTLTNKTLGTGTAISGNLSMSSNRITNLGVPATSTDAATRQYVDDAVAAGTAPGGGGFYTNPPQSTTTGSSATGSSTSASRGDHVHNLGAHASTHGAAGSDPITISTSQVSGINNYLTTSAAASTYVTQSAANTTYVYRSELFNPFLLMGA